MKINHIYCGKAHEVLSGFPGEVFNTCVTSPPYLWHRDYEHNDQLGDEPTPEAYVRNLVNVFSEVKRTLKNDGTLWLNIGETYVNPGRPGGKHGTSVIMEDGKERIFKRRRTPAGLKPKDMIGVPWRTAFALQGVAVVPMMKFTQWANILREARDKNDWEAVSFVEDVLRQMDLLSELQGSGYYLRQEIIWSKPNAMPEPITDRCTKQHELIFLLSKSKKYYFDYKAIMEPMSQRDIFLQKLQAADNPESILKGSPFNTGKTALSSNNGRIFVKNKGFKQGSKYQNMVKHPGDPNYRSGYEQLKSVYFMDASGMRRKRSVCEVSTRPYHGGHFAVFPEELIVDCIKAGCPPGGIVLDPFGGRGTTGVVAKQLDRDYVLIELNPDTVKESKEYISERVGIFNVEKTIF